MKREIAVLLCLSTGLTGCASIFTKASDTITIHSSDRDATILVNGNEIGKGQATYQVKKGKPVTLTAHKQGCSDRAVMTEESFNKAAILNTICLLCWIIDLVTGKIHKTDPTDYAVNPSCS